MIACQQLDVTYVCLAAWESHVVEPGQPTNAMARPSEAIMPYRGSAQKSTSTSDNAGKAIRITSRMISARMNGPTPA